MNAPSKLWPSTEEAAVWAHQIESAAELPVDCLDCVELHAQNQRLRSIVDEHDNTIRLQRVRIKALQKSTKKAWEWTFKQECKWLIFGALGFQAVLYFWGRFIPGLFGF